jgi:pimeloyl-ACP methyl ester carboxylesterase
MTPVRSLVVDGTEIQVEGEGARALVMVHGWPDTQALWTPQVAHFRSRFRCVRFTLPGFEPGGRARALAPAQMVSHLADILQAVSPGEPVALMLHDWGAVYGWQLAMQHPTRVARIVGIDIGDTASAEFRRSLSPVQRAGIAAYQLTLAAAWKLPASLGDAVTRRMARALRAPAPQAAHAGMNHPYAAFWSGGFKGSRPVQPACPTLFVWGERKPFLFHAPAWADRLAATPGCASVGLRAGHWVSVNQPEAFHRTVDDWLRATGGPSV